MSHKTELEHFQEGQVIVYRWDGRLMRYRKVVTELRGVPYEMCCDQRGHESCGGKHEADKAQGAQVLAMRNQQVERVQFDPQTGTLELFTRPAVMRIWQQTRDGARKSKKLSKPNPNSPRCACHHYESDHDIEGVCLIPGCTCKNFSALKKLMIQSP